MAPSKRSQLKPWRTELIGAILTAALGFVLWYSRLGNGLVHLSYDLLFPFQSQGVMDEVVILYLDEATFKETNEQPDVFSRAHHANLLHFLTRQSVRLVVFDVFFGDRTAPEVDEQFAQAIRANGKVILPAVRQRTDTPGLETASFLRPLPILVDAAADWGVTEVQNPGEVVRQSYPGGPSAPSLAAVAARFVGTPADQLTPDVLATHWLNYYGPEETFRSFSFVQATNQPVQVFRDKCVFIGSRPKTQAALDEEDEFLTPYGRLPGVNIVATAFLNLVRNDTLTRLSVPVEFALLLICGVAAGYGLTRVRPLGAMALAFGAALLLGAVALALFRAQHSWFCWTVIAGGQLPFAFAWSLVFRTRKLEAMVEDVTERASLSSPRAPLIPQHILLRRIGRGSYGEVWLARNQHHYDAVKIVYLDSFDSPAPYEREYKGIQKYGPVSSAHPGLVNILQTGRNNDQGYFFYAMEIADDIETGQQFDPDRYKPKTLSSELDRRGALPAEACLTLMLTLTQALHHLHQHQLIHRDIKPPNIIYAGGTPKFADIGLVTDIAATGKSVTFIGTLGYLAPEGPGTPQADLYSLGKVLYVACFNRDPELFPELPTGLGAQPQTELLRSLNRIAGKACQTDPSLRYASAADMYSDLAQLT